ncbi:protein Lines homolog 1 isoform X2 [Pungitius pungitius]|uniref:protein Lines homolog 1 isoform X2 n=1 Tax=Pungitius pungitius TaxID=134920 RepID=UPI002E110C70
MDERTRTAVCNTQSALHSALRLLDPVRLRCYSLQRCFRVYHMGASIMESEAGIMEHTDQSTITERVDRLTDAYRSLLMGSCPSQSAEDVALLISSAVRGLVPHHRARAPAGICNDSWVDVSCLSLTLLVRITSNLTSRSLSPAVTWYCEDILALSFQRLALMSRLIDQFQNDDRVVSHLAAKAVSACVFHQLHQSGIFSPVWLQKCVQVFSCSSHGPDLDSCLWSLTEVLKRLLKGPHQDLLGELLAALDASLSALCSKFLPEERTAGAQCLMDATSTAGLLLDLLEVLTASSLIGGADLCLKSQRITIIHSSALLTTVSCSPQYFVKKRALLLLKRAVLQKAGEDWASAGLLSTALRYNNFHSDMNMLAHSVLTAVAAGWLQSVQVKSASYFGGTKVIRGEEGHKPDCVVLRAVSLLLLKSMELHIQTARATGVDSALEVYGYLQSLWGFLRRCSVQLTEVTHPCCWFSLLFGDQDDDMMEAAKALFSIFLHHRRCSGLDDLALLEAACAHGSNPHCHFLLLLQTISFDHSILLDFLISTETCFLEYFVRYLKYLRGDWQGFVAACGRISWHSSPLPLQHSLTESGGGDMVKVTCKGRSDQVVVSACVQPTTGGILQVGTINLVGYDSSDQSDPENMEVSEEEAGPSVCESNKCRAMDVKPKISGPPVPMRQKQYGSAVCKPNSPLQRRPEGPSVLQIEQPSPCPTMSGQLGCETSARAVLCMSQLREVVTRLHSKKLFPYNPCSLLKLLAQVDNCSQPHV